MLGGRTNIGIKRMGEIDSKPFQNTCKQRFPLEEANVQASTLCSLWQENLKDPNWHPFKIIDIDGNTQVYSFKYSLSLLFLYSCMDLFRSLCEFAFVIYIIKLYMLF
jgi:hypothetical protein